MNRKAALFLLLSWPLIQTDAQWTSPRILDATNAASQRSPLVAIGPDRELVIVCTESSGSGKLLCYKSTDLGATFSRIIVAEGGSMPPWYSWTAGTPAGVAFSAVGTAFLLSSYVYVDDQASFSRYVISRLRRDSTSFVAAWQAEGPGGPITSTLALPAMAGGDSTLHVLRDARSPLFDYTFMYAKLSGDGLLVEREDTMFTLPNGWFSADLTHSSLAVHCAASASDIQGRGYKLYYTRMLYQDSVFSPLIPVDTVYATLPHIVDLHTGDVALVYAAGNGSTNSDSLLMACVFPAGSTTLPPPREIDGETSPAYKCCGALPVAENADTRWKSSPRVPEFQRRSVHGCLLSVC